MKTRSVILDTDWFTDVDDAMALRILINLHKKRIFRLLGVCINAKFDESARSLDAFLLAHGVDLPVGIVQDWHGDSSGHRGPSYQKRLATLPSKYAGNAAAESPVKLYRRLLAISPDPVELLSIGFTENYAALLQSTPDEYSQLNGIQLVKEKVSHLWMMAGRWPEGSEYNLTGGSPVNPLVTQSGSLVLANWPTPITFLGFEIGNTILSGAELPPDDLLRQAMEDFDATYKLGGKTPNLPFPANPQSHFSWDPLLVLLAAGIVSPQSGHYSEVRGHASSDPATGRNRFREDPTGPHAYIVKRRPDAEYARILDSWLHPME